MNIICIVLLGIIAFDAVFLTVMYLVYRHERRQNK